MNSETLLHWLQRTSIEASLLILAVLGLRLMLGTRLSPAWRIGLWMLVGAKLMLPAFIPAGFGLGSLWKDKADIIDQRTAPHLSEPSVYSVPSVVETQPSSAPTPIPHSTFSTPHFLLTAWLLGSIAVLLIALIQQTRFNAVLRRRPRCDEPRLRAFVASLAQKAGIGQPVSIVLMPAGTTPAMVGIRQAKLLLPVDWSTRFDESSLRHVLLHELFHIRHRDLIWNWAATAVQTLHWFNPLVWFVVSRFQADRELRCDAAALDILAPSERLDYGRTLLRIQETFFAPPAIAGLAPCVCNHPTLRQRILMIATPTTRQPWLHALLVLTLSLLVGYSFTTARAAEKEVPPKVREGGTAQKTPTDQSNQSDQADPKKPAMSEGKGEDGKPGAKREGDGKKPRSSEREGDGARKPGTRDGEKPRAGTRDDEKPRTGEREGEDGKKPRSSEREGDGARKPGMRDGEKPRAGERDGEKPRTGERDGEKPRTGVRDGEGATKVRKGDGAAATSSGETITIRVSKDGETAMVGDKEVAMSGLRGHLSNFLPEHPGAKIIVTGDADTPLKALHGTVDAVRDNGNKNVSIAAE